MAPHNQQHSKWKDPQIPEPIYNGTLADHLQAIMSLRKDAMLREFTHWIAKFEVNLKNGTAASRDSAFQDLLTLLEQTEQLSHFHRAYIYIAMAENGRDRGRAREEVLAWAYDCKKHMALFREGNPDANIGKADALYHLIQHRADKVLLEIEIGRRTNVLRQI